MSWTDERVEILKRLWSEGLSCSQCAAALGHGVTRNAVIGKIHRLGLSQRAKAQIIPRAIVAEPPRRRAPARRHAPRVVGNIASSLAPRIAMPETGQQEEVVIPLSERVSLLELGGAMCRWPIGDPASSEFRFCGAKAQGGGGPYCGYHAQVAYQPTQDRRRAREKARAPRKNERRERAVDCGEAAGGGR